MTTPRDSDGPARPAEADLAMTPQDDTSAAGNERRGFWPAFRLWILRGVAVVAAFLVFAIICTAGAGWYTSRPQFCRSCHIMEPYFVSWEESSHKDVSCIKCHFPPGVGEKVRGKMLGLVQLAKYVTSSQGPRPAAEIPDASCLRSGCHETRLLAGRIDFQGIPFDHTPHLQQLRRGKQLRCTSCHSQIVQGAHMTVTATTCFLCHFKGEFFNEGLGTCTRCHQIPEAEYELGGGVKFDHDLAYQQGVDCANCHADLIRGTGEVPQERCSVCHNRVDDLKRIDDHAFMHQMHVTDHKVDCLACHLTIHHSLDPHKIENASQDCKSCHPNHHHEQVDMLLGKGSRTLEERPGEQPGGMAAVRIACPTCHRVEQKSPTGTVLLNATVQTCSACHPAERVVRLETYYTEVTEALAGLDEAAARATEALATAPLSPRNKAALQSILTDVEADLAFLRAANGIHNLHYATTVTRRVLGDISQVCRKLNIDEPEVVLPEVIREYEGDIPPGPDAANDAGAGEPDRAAGEETPSARAAAEQTPPERTAPAETPVEADRPEPSPAEAGAGELPAAEETAPEVDPTRDVPPTDSAVEAPQVVPDAAEDGAAAEAGGEAAAENGPAGDSGP